MSKLDRLQPVELREIWPNEAADFTPWLAEEENLILLGETLGMELEFEGQEINAGDFRADILCRNTEDDSRVLIENQLGRTNHKHLGQILTYSAGLNIHTVIWIARKFRAEHRAALDRLNKITDEHFRYFGIEIKVWQIGNSACAPQFEIVSKPNDWNRTVSRETQRAESKDFSEARLQRKKFWAQFRDYMIQKSSQLQIRERKSTRALYFHIGRRGFMLGVWQRVKRKDIGVSIYITGQNSKAYFDLLKEQRQEIDKKLGGQLVWWEDPKGKGSRVYLKKDSMNLTDETDWHDQHEWLASKLELFDKVFRPRIKVLNAADWESPEYEDDE